MLSPILFTAAAIVWHFVSDVGREQNRKVDTGLGQVERDTDGSIMSSVITAFRSFGKAFYLGAIIVLSSRKYVWLVTGYSGPWFASRHLSTFSRPYPVALYAHRYLENGLAPIFAKVCANYPICIDRTYIFLCRVSSVILHSRKSLSEDPTSVNYWEQFQCYS
jgi:hypothetical protein